MQACAHRQHLRKGKVHDAHRSCCFRFLFCKSTHRVSIQASRQPPNALLKKSRRHKSFTLEQTFPMIPFTRALNHCSRQPNKQRYQHARTDCYSPTTRSHGLRRIFTLHLMTSCRTMSHCQSRATQCAGPIAGRGGHYSGWSGSILLTGRPCASGTKP